MRRQLAAAEARAREAEARAQALHAEPGVVVVVAEAVLEETAVSPCRLPLPTADDPAAVSPPSPSKKKLGPATPKRGSGGYIGGFTTIVPEPELEPVRAAPFRGGMLAASPRSGSSLSRGRCARHSN